MISLWKRKRRGEARSELRRDREKSERWSSSDEVGEPTRGTLRSEGWRRDMGP